MESKQMPLTTRGYVAIAILVVALVLDGLYVALLLGAFDKKRNLKKPDPVTDTSTEFCGQPDKFGQKC